MRPLARLRSRRIVPQRSAAELEAMAAAGAVVATALQAVHAAAVAGASTLSLDGIAESVIREAGATPSFLGYHGYPASICASVNDRVVHGIPSAAELLALGDLVSIDCGAVLDGWHGDAAVLVDLPVLAGGDRRGLTELKHAWHPCATRRPLCDSGASIASRRAAATLQ